MSDMTASKAIAEVKKFAQFIHAFEHLSETATFLAQAENLVLEADKCRQKIDTETAERTAALGSLERQINTRKLECTALVSNAEDRAAEILSKAEAEALEVTEHAADMAALAAEELDKLGIQSTELGVKFAAELQEYERLSKRMHKVRADIRAFVGEGG